MGRKSKRRTPQRDASASPVHDDDDAAGTAAHSGTVAAVTSDDGGASSMSPSPSRRDELPDGGAADTSPTPHHHPHRETDGDAAKEEREEDDAATADNVISVLRVNLAEALKLNEEFEEDLRVAVQCMSDCEEERKTQVRQVEAERDALAGDVSTLQEDLNSLRRELAHKDAQLQAAGRSSQRPHRQSPPPHHQAPVGASSSSHDAVTTHRFERGDSLADAPTASNLAREQLESKAAQLFHKAEQQKFRHMDSLTGGDDDYDLSRGSTSEVTFRLRIPAARSSLAAAGNSTRRGPHAGRVTTRGAQVPMTVAGTLSPSAASVDSRRRSPSATTQRSGTLATMSPMPSSYADPMATASSPSPPSPSVPPLSGYEGEMAAADTARLNKQLQLEVAHLRQRIALLQRGSGGGSTPSRRGSSPTSGSGTVAVTAASPTTANLHRSRLASAVQDTLIRGLARASADARELRGMVAGLEVKVRRRQVCSSNSASSFSRVITAADGLLHLVDGLRVDGSSILRGTCTPTELRHAGAVGATPAALVNGGDADPPSPTQAGNGTARETTVTSARGPPSRAWARASASARSLDSVGSGSWASGSDPASGRSPKWVLTDGASVRVAPGNQPQAARHPHGGGSDQQSTATATRHFADWDEPEDGAVF